MTLAGLWLAIVSYLQALSLSRCNIKVSFDFGSGMLPILVKKFVVICSAVGC
jgi:hypothetical protein